MSTDFAGEQITITFRLPASMGGRPAPDVDRVMKRTARTFAAYFTCTTLAIASEIALAEGVYRITGACLVFCLAVRTAQCGLAHYRLREGRVAPFGEYALHPSEWMPPPVQRADNTPSGLPFGHRIERVRNALHRARQLPYRAWCLVRGSIPPAPAGTLRLEYDSFPEPLFPPMPPMPKGDRRHG